MSCIVTELNAVETSSIPRGVLRMLEHLSFEDMSHPGPKLDCP